MEITVLLLFLIAVFFIERRRSRKKSEIASNRYTIIGKTTHCRKNFRSSMFDLYYEFVYKGHRYSGSVKFDKSKRGNICYNVPVLVEFDSLSPVNNHVILDSSNSLR